MVQVEDQKPIVCLWLIRDLPLFSVSLRPNLRKRAAAIELLSALGAKLDLANGVLRPRTARRSSARLAGHRTRADERANR